MPQESPGREHLSIKSSRGSEHGEEIKKSSFRVVAGQKKRKPQRDVYLLRLDLRTRFFVIIKMVGKAKEAARVGQQRLRRFAVQTIQ